MGPLRSLRCYCSKSVFLNACDRRAPDKLLKFRPWISLALPAGPEAIVLFNKHTSALEGLNVHREKGETQSGAGLLRRHPGHGSSRENKPERLKFCSVTRRKCY